MRLHKELFRKIREGEATFFLGATFNAVVAFIRGYDFACEGGLLRGFREWLVVRLGDEGHATTAWPWLALHVAFPDIKDPRTELTASPGFERKAVTAVWELLSEFDHVLEERGLGSVFLAYHEWYRSTVGTEPGLWPPPI